MPTYVNPKRILWYEIGAFSVIILSVWMGSLIPLLQGRRTAMEWEDPLLETATVLLVAFPTVLLSRRLLSHLHYLEGFLRVCAWCHKVRIGDDWVPFEEFMKRRLSTQTSHGICENCNQTFRAEAEKRKQEG